VVQEVYGSCAVCSGPLDGVTDRRTPHGIMCGACALRADLAQVRGQANSASSSDDSIWLGLLAALLCGPLALILIIVLAKGPKTRTGALYGFVAWIALFLMVNIMLR
jgi:hypothetical protein